jgi:hypothetical protein
MPNAEKILGVLNAIQADLAAWSQSDWAALIDIKGPESVESLHASSRVILFPECGTAYCAAGHAAVNEGYKFATRFHADESAVSVLSPVQAEQLAKTGSFEGQMEPVEMVSAVLLGLTPMQAEAFFHPSNWLIDLWGYAHVFTGGQIELPESLPEVPESTRRDCQPGFASRAAIESEFADRADIRGSYLTSVGAWLDDRRFIPDDY